MEQSTKEAWRRLLDEARRELPDATVRTWLEPAVPIALDDDRLIVGAPDQFAVEWNEQKHASVLARAAERVFGRPTAVVFRVQEDRQQRPQMDFFVAPREAVALDKTGGVTTPLNERYTFQTFVIGKSHELAAAAAHAVAAAPAQGDPWPRGPADLTLRVGAGGGHRAPRSRAPNRHPAQEGGAGSSRAHHSRRRAALHRRAHPLERARARRLHHQAAAVRVAQESRSHDRTGARGALGQD